MMQDLMCTYLLIVNLVAFALYGIDKSKARRNKWRIKEAVLIGVAYLGGCYGALVGMFVFHHKTKKSKFKLLVPLAVIIYTFLLGKFLG